VSRDAPDELQGGSEPDPGRRSPWVQALAAVAVLAVALLAVRGAVRSPDPAPAPTPTSTATGQPTRTPDPVVTAGDAGLAGPLAVGAVCPHTDGTHTLSVQFQIENIGVGRVTVLAVRPVLPIGGLRPGKVTLPRSPDCGTPAAHTGTSTVLEPGDRVGAQLDFGLPAGCPAPYPVEADVDLLMVGESPGTQQLLLLADLGGLDFTTC
jgi:hypothetical protein